jgi:serine/threonine-protein kinase
MPIRKILNIALYGLVFFNLFFITAIIAYQVTIHGEMSTVPDLKGKTFEEGRTELKSKKLIIIHNGSRLHDRYEKGMIISQDPAPGKKIKLHQEVKVILSAEKEKVIVPRLRGRSFQLISSTLNETGLKKGRGSHVYTRRYSAGRIIAQSPVPGEIIPKGTRISFLVSEGDKERKYLMPDLIGRNADKVIAYLKKKGFRVSDLRESFYPGIESGIIINQLFPKPGYPVQKRTLITLEVSK